MSDSTTSISGRGITTVEVDLPNRFDMELNSVSGQLAALTFYTDKPSREAMTGVLARLKNFLDGGDRDGLFLESVCFQTPAGPRNISLDVAANNQLLGACRSIREFSCGYEPDVACAMSVLTKADAIIVNAGSNWGPLSVQHALNPAFRGCIHAFEPQRKAFDMLERIVGELHMSARIRPQRFALSDVAGEARLSSEIWSGNVFVTDTDGGENCPMARLDDLLPDVLPDLIKIDVEGFESKVIAGAEKMINRSRPHIIFEDWMHNDKQHFERLALAGYAFHYLAWYDPFQDTLSEKPPFTGSKQLLAFKTFTAAQRADLPTRINVLAAARPLPFEQQDGQ